MIRFFTFVAAIVLLILGLILLPLPIPLGAPLLVIGSAMMISVSPAFARLVANARERWQRFDDALSFLEVRAPETLAEILRKTRPESG
ncbi:MAG: hypothetical protein ACFCUN_05050 [Hyphomicrobiaceae bacterium]